MARKKQAGTPLDQAVAVVRGLQNLCDPECEGRCRVCPQEAIDSLLLEIAKAIPAVEPVVGVKDV